MGGNAAMSIALRHPDRFDNFADLGGEPGPSMIYSLGMVRDFLFGGFCTADDEAHGLGAVGQLCPNPTSRADQFEITADYEHMVYQSGDGVGLTLDRSLYMKASRDLARALSNPALYSATNAYAPPGVDFSYFAMDAATRCATPTVLTNFHDREFNPDGSKPVITYCDGGDGSVLGTFDGTKPQLDPAEILLAVDLNGNGKRDAGEPVITDAYEPFSDIGTDGLADKDEPGYDPVTVNPDPNHDDYHWQRNPLGTENNGTYDVGEPYEDVGLDGVAGTCQQGSSPNWLRLRRGQLDTLGPVAERRALVRERCRRRARDADRCAAPPRRHVVRRRRARLPERERVDERGRRQRDGEVRRAVLAVAGLRAAHRQHEREPVRLHRHQVGGHAAERLRALRQPRRDAGPDRRRRRQARRHADADHQSRGDRVRVPVGALARGRSRRHDRRTARSST